MKRRMSSEEYLKFQDQTIQKMRDPDDDEPIAEPEPEPKPEPKYCHKHLRIKRKNAQLIALMALLIIIGIVISAALNDGVAQVISALLFAVGAIFGGGVYHFSYRNDE